MTYLDVAILNTLFRAHGFVYFEVEEGKKNNSGNFCVFFMKIVDGRAPNVNDLKLEYIWTPSMHVIGTERSGETCVRPYNSTTINLENMNSRHFHFRHCAAVCASS